MRPAIFATLAVVLCLLGASPALAVDFELFDCITDNAAGNCTIGETQLSATIVESGGDALITITMTGPADAVVEQLFIESTAATGISFDGSTELGIVAFGTGAAGGNLPGGNPVGFTSSWNISADNPAPRNGIGRHDQDDVSPQGGAFLLSYTGDFEALLAGLRIGVHVQGYDSGGSEGFVSRPVPEPSAFVLVTGGLVGMSVLRRRKPRARPR